MKVIKLIVLLQFFTLTLCAQITGNSTVQVYTVEQYTLNQGTIYSNPRWSAIGGVIQSDTRNVTTYTITVKWDVQGAGKVNFLNENVVIASRDITITGCTLAPPDPVATLSSTNPVCGPKSLSYTGTPPANVKWYWQTTSSGTDETNAGGYVANASGTYYLRAKTNCGPLWSGGSLSITISVNPNPAVPNAPVVSSNTCGDKTLTMNSPPGGNITWYWQGTNASGASNTNSDLTYVVSTAGTSNYYLRALNTTSGCWSPSSAGASVTVTSPGPPYCSSSYLNSVLSASPDSWSMSYTDGFGNPLQNQMMDMLTGTILASVPIKDSYGSVSGNTFYAPVEGTTFNYKYNFASNATGQPYSAGDFDRPIVNNSPGEINNPKPIVSGGPYTLGWYYSSSNTLEPKTPVTGFPYSRVYIPEGPNPTTVKVAGAGDQYKMGSGHEQTVETQKFTKLELVHYYNLKPFFVDANVYEDNLIVNADANSVTGYTLNKNVTVSSVNLNNQTYVKVVSNQSGNTPGVWPIEGAITVKPGTAYVLKVKGYGSTTNARLYVRSGTTGSNIVWPGATLPAGSAAEGWVQSSFTVPAGVTSISVGVLFNVPSIGNEIYINSIILNAGTNSAIPGYKEIGTNADGKKTVSFFDMNGNVLATANYNGSALENWSYNYYNDVNQLVASVAPNGVITTSNNYPNFVTKYKYDHLGRLIETTSTDQGTSKVVYNTDGQIRFSQNAQQKTESKFSYTNYDRLGRPVESGEYTTNDASAYIFETHDIGTTPSTMSVLNIIDNNIPLGYTAQSITSAVYTGISESLDAARCNDHTYIIYDYQTGDLPTGDLLHGSQKFVSGRISKTKNALATTWYSYTEDGSLEWTKQQIAGLPNYQTIDYSYDYVGKVTRVAYNKDVVGQFYHFFEYFGDDSRLVKSYTSTDGVTKKLAARYYYYLHGPLKRVELGTNVQGIDYVYNVDGTLKLINHADAALDPGLDGISGTNAGFIKDVFG
jgi:YD repeat-containing protein